MYDYAVMAKANERRDEKFDADLSKRLADALPDREIMACAAATKIDQSTLHRWLNDPPRQIGDIKRVADFCGVSSGELAFGEKTLSIEDERTLDLIEATPALESMLALVSTIVSHDAALSEYLGALPKKSEVAVALIGLKDHVATLVRESKEYQVCLDAAVLLDRIFAALPEESKLDALLAVSSKKPKAKRDLFQQHQAP